MDYHNRDRPNCSPEGLFTDSVIVFVSLKYWPGIDGYVQTDGEQPIRALSSRFER